jgi:LL-diaminopimelate aminotransferase
MSNAKMMKQGLESVGLKVFGGVNAPYVWVKTPEGMGSWKFFDQLLYETYVVTTPA